MSVTIRVEHPYASYQFSQTLPTIDNVGVTISDVDYATIVGLIAAMPHRNRPRILVLPEPPDPPYEPPEHVFATQDYVNDALAELGLGDQIVHEQVSPSAQWLINFTPGRRPGFLLDLDSSPGELVQTDVFYTDDSALIEFAVPESGKAYQI